MLSLGRIAGAILPAGLPRFQRWPRSLKALQHRDYRLIWGGALVSNVGSWIQNIAQAWLVYDLTKSAMWLGVDAFAGDLPILFLLPLGGVLADRIDRRVLLVWLNVLSALLAAALAVMCATGFLTAERVWIVVALSAVRGVLDAVRIPTNQAIVPAMVGQADLSNAIALNTIQFNLSRALGPALAGVALVTLGVSWSFALNALSFLAMIAALMMLRTRPETPDNGNSMAEELREGVRYARNRPDLLTMMALIALGSMLCAPIASKMLPVVAEQVFAMGAVGYSQLVSAFGIGAVLGALWLAVRSHAEPRPWSAIPMLMLLGLCELIVGFGGSFVAALVLVAACGVSFVGGNVLLKTVIIHSCPDAMRGRVISFQSMAFRLGMPLGSLLAGWLATRFGVAWALWTYGAALVLLAPLGLIGLHRAKTPT